MTYLWARAEGVPSYVGKTDEEDNRIWWNDPGMGGVPLPSVEEWPALTLVPFKKRSKKRILDVFASGSCHLISQQSVNELKDIWERHAELYPLQLSNHGDDVYYMVVVKTKLDCLFREQSKGIKAIYGTNPGQFTTLQEWSFDDEVIADNDLFVISDSPTAIYASEKFKQRITESGLKGFCLKNYYSEFDPWIS